MSWSYDLFKTVKEVFHLGYPSKDEMFSFFNETDKKAQGGDVSAVPTQDELKRLGKIIYIFQTQLPNHYWIDRFSEKWLNLYQNLSPNSGLVYYGHLIKTHPSNALPHHYGEFAYRHNGGYLFYAGFFYLGIPSGECRLSINGKRSCYGQMTGNITGQNIALYFRSH
ncbi:MAG: hypothetical protein ACK5QJ_07535 [Microcystis sp.]|jgi:hypothetical protein|uniref:hypothetical protein n=1 Tax=Microcystis sp. TaxID=1127 RepID=UPI0022C6198B|nr:hypothetical protein [Microcystis sp. LE17-20D]MCZ8066265.1 hypothetical protein [Microcystis sp. LE17-20D]MCZ8160361.1 hypothetical protein [Microcystis sp. LE19-196.1B]MCZ8276376.1 hypothetical protein [Microcystis sp. LE19-4.1E]